MRDTNGNWIIPGGDPRFRHIWANCNHYHEKCPWSLEGECDLEYQKRHLIDLAGKIPYCPFRYREQI